MLIKLSEIISWAGNNPNQKNIHDAERILSAGHLITCGINHEKSDDKVTAITALCIQTSHMKAKPHEINAVISKSGSIISIVCSCKAGLGEKCKHSIATLLYCYRKGDELRILSCTEQKCKWKDLQSHALQQYEPAPIEQHPCFSKSKKKILIEDMSKNSMSSDPIEDHSKDLDSDSESNEDDISILEKSGSTKIVTQHRCRRFVIKDSTADEYKILHAKIMEELVESAFAKHILGRHDPILVSRNNNLQINNEDQKIIDAIFTHQRCELMEDIKNLKVNYSEDCCQETIRLCYEDFEEICAKTKSNYAEWHKARKFRITGSVCYKIFTYTRNKNADWKKQAKELFDPASFTSKYTEHGRNTEKDAREAFVKVTQKTVVETGLIISKQNPWLAYSPDGIIMSNGIPSALLEIRCPSKGKSKGIAEIVQSEIKKSLNLEGENIVLKERHEFYGQIQLGMAVINLKQTFFVIYSSFDEQLFIITVDFNEEYVKKMLEALKKAYYEKLLHEICLIQRKN